jgi:hypothetical protein
MMATEQAQDRSALSERVSIDIFGQRLSVRPHPSCLSELLTRRFCAREGEGDVGVQTTLESLIAPAIPFANAGLLDVVEFVLGREGIEFERIFESSFPPLDAPRLENIALHGAADLALLQVLNRRARGVVRYGPHCSLAWFIQQAALAYPDATFTVVTSRAGDRDSIAAQLAKRHLDVTTVQTANPPIHVGRVAVSTWYALGHPQTESWRRTFMLVPNAIDAISARAQDVLLQPDATFRLFGFLPADRRLSPRERDLLACVFGLGELVIPTHGHVGRHVCVDWRRFRNSAVQNADLSHSERKAALIWRNRDRNRLITGIARAAATERTPENLLQSIAGATSQEARTRPLAITVLVEGIDHAARLASMLPEWPVRTAPTLDCSGLSDRQTQVLNQGIRRPMTVEFPHTIATVAGLAADRLASTDVLLWTGGGPAPPPLPETGLQTTAEALHPLLIIDIDDRPARWLRRATEARTAAYAERGWFATGTDSYEARIEQFIAMRPQGDLR